MQNKTIAKKVDEIERQINTGRSALHAPTGKKADSAMFDAQRYAIGFSYRAREGHLTPKGLIINANRLARLIAAARPTVPAIDGIALNALTRAQMAANALAAALLPAPAPAVSGPAKQATKRPTMNQNEFIVKADAAKDQAQVYFRNRRLTLRQYGCILRNIGATVKKHETESAPAESRLAEILQKLT